jgi:hypothetical protein
MIIVYRNYSLYIHDNGTNTLYMSFGICHLVYVI